MCLMPMTFTSLILQVNILLLMGSFLKHVTLWFLIPAIRNYVTNMRNLRGSSFSFLMLTILSHSPYNKLVQKSFSRLLFNDFSRNPSSVDEDAKDKMESFSNLSVDESYQSPDLVKERPEAMARLKAIGFHRYLLAPSASIFVSDRMLKVVTLTKDALGEFDWSSFILEELSQQIHKFNKDSHKSKATKRKTVGGCVYFLMLFCLQNFAFGDKVASEHESAMAYWTDDRVKSRALMEKKAKQLLARLSRSRPSTLRRHRLTLTPCSLTQKDDEDDEKEIEDEDDEKDKEDEDDHIVDIDDEDSHLHDTPIVQHGLHVEPTEEYVVEEEVVQPQLQEGERRDRKIRRSKRVITHSSVLKSPWIDPNRKTKGKRQYDEKEQLYELCTTKSIPKDEAGEEFVDMNGWHLQREELLCLRPRTWINNMVMTMIAKTLVADQLDNGGTVTRHIFSPHFMEKMIEDPMTWPLEANKAEILPDRIGYNIGDCRFIFGPSLRWDHWFCYVLDTTTMTFYTLDSIPKGVTWSKVHVQTDVDSCGVHVVSWLQMWDATEQEDGYTMPFYSMDDIRELKIGMLWWLISQQISRPLYDSKVEPATMIPKQVCDMYTASFYAAFVSLIQSKHDTLMNSNST
ncbi:hypothetical protein K1719_035315 [Acacia pycnantha]|nr:hypothetical protein K1719_035315 [Acacia pycnantha]